MIDDNDEILGVVIVEINDDNINHLDFPFVRVGVQSKGIGQTIWKEIEKIYSDTKVWKTCTPYFDKRNIHFYVNRCGFKIVEFFNPKHKDSHQTSETAGNIPEENNYFFRFEKEMS